MPDLDQSNEFVKDYLYKWVNKTVSKFGFDGIRVDTERHVHIDFWAEYNRSAGVYAVGEVMNGDVSYCANYQKNALDSVLNYPQYYAVHQNVFTNSHSMYEIRTYLNLTRTINVNPDVNANPKPNLEKILGANLI